MENSYSESYKKSGVDLKAGYKAVELMRPHVEKTFTKGVIGNLGGFGGLFEPDLSGISDPVLVSGTDGIGTKLKIAFLTDKHDTIGIDCVAMCANDIVCSGAKPLFFLDYIALGKNEPEKVASIVKGISTGCVEAGCALIGGETAEMPGFYEEGEYDVAGFCVGVVSKSKITDYKTVKPGDVIIGLASSGVHSNGFSLVRKVLRIRAENINSYVPILGKTLGEELLTPTVIYVKPVLAAMKAALIKGAAHITGGGFYENIPRMLPEGVRARIKKNVLPVPEIFSLIAQNGTVDEHDMYNTFNMGVGMALITEKAMADAAIQALKESGTQAEAIGECVAGETGIDLL